MAKIFDLFHWCEILIWMIIEWIDSWNMICGKFTENKKQTYSISKIDGCGNKMLWQNS